MQNFELLTYNRLLCAFRCFYNLCNALRTTRAIKIIEDSETKWVREYPYNWRDALKSLHV